MNKQTTITLVKLTAGLSLFTGIIAFIFLIFLPSHQSDKKTTPTPTPSTSQGSSNEGSGPTATPTPTGQNGEQGYCTQDAKLCPDGSYVGRIGPNCEFAKCPGE